MWVVLELLNSQTFFFNLHGFNSMLLTFYKSYFKSFIITDVHLVYTSDYTVYNKTYTSSLKWVGFPKSKLGRLCLYIFNVHRVISNLVSSQLRTARNKTPAGVVQWQSCGYFWNGQQRRSGHTLAYECRCQYEMCQPPPVHQALLLDLSMPLTRS